MFFTSRNRRLVANVKKLEELEKNVIFLNEENKEHLNIIENREKALQKIISEKSIGFPWLAEAIGEFYKFQDFLTSVKVVAVFLFQKKKTKPGK